MTVGRAKRTSRRPDRARWIKRLIGFVVGLVLLGVAVWVLGANSETVRDAYEQARLAPIWLLVIVVILPVLHWNLTSIVFWLVTRRFGVVSLAEMHALIGAASLLNYLPMRPGLFGRIAYHRKVNHIRLQDSVRVTVECSALGAVASVLAILISLAVLGERAWISWVALAVPLVVFGAGGLVLCTVEKSPFGRNPAMTLALGARYLDTLVWVARYTLAFAIIGQPITPVQAAIFAAAAQVAMTVPFVGAGLGVREWAIGLSLPLLRRDAARTIGLTADLFNRATEVLSAVPIGLVCLVVLQRRRRRLKAGEAHKSG